MEAPPSIGLCVQLACIWEVLAPKAGNVDRRHDFADLGLVDFLAAAAAIAPVFEQAPHRDVGDTVLAAVEATRQVTGTNVNLGMVLLLAPLARVPRDVPLVEGIGPVLDALTVEDARRVYRAIRLAQPGGLGKVPDQDVAAEPTLTLKEAMGLAADRDLVARQYAEGFRTVLQEGMPTLARTLERTGALPQAIVLTQLHLMQRHPDSLIARKCGPEEARRSAILAGEVLEAGYPDTVRGREKYAELDAWLRADGHRRNPGTTADMVAACLFAALRDRIMKLQALWPRTVDRMP